ncbi:MAG: hypothetical protein BAJALOKI2v1_10076 [Promethearchaeota archaeon]|nr:MAG: hypothetical protein BAJALOKI2v1_10076 [Candidatus Lokiarchaeota archaeon]
MLPLDTFKIVIQKINYPYLIYTNKTIKNQLIKYIFVSLLSKRILFIELFNY